MVLYLINSKYLFDIDNQTLSKQNLICKKNNNCELFKYDRYSKINNIDLVKECRGIIINRKTRKFLCLPPIKNENEKTFLDNNNLKDCNIEEFIDGTMVNIYWNDNKIHYSTRSQIEADEQNYGILRGSFKELFLEVLTKYNFNLEDNLDKDICLSCVLCHVDNTIVKQHKENQIYLVEAKRIVDDKYNILDINDSKELKNILFERPNQYSFENIDELYTHLDIQPYEFKGFILKNNNNTTKIMNKTYLEMMDLRRLDIKNTKNLYYTIKQSGQLTKFLKYFPIYSSIFTNYKLEYENLINFLYINYRKRWVIKNNRVKKISDLKYECRPIIYNLHKKYLSSRNIITKNVINEYIINLPIHSILNTLKVL